MKNSFDLKRCAVLSNLDMSDNLSLEMHHCPLTLFDIISIVINYRFSQSKKVTTFSIADEVINLHLKGAVGVVPLSISIHQMVHERSVIIHPAMVSGNYLEFIRSYANGIDEEMFLKIKNFLEISEEALNNSLKNLHYNPLILSEETKKLIPTKKEIAELLNYLQIQN